MHYPVSTRREMLIEPLRGRYPSYFLYGPLAFSPVTGEFLAGIERAGDRFFSLLAAIGSLATRRGDRPSGRGSSMKWSSLDVPRTRSKRELLGNPFIKVVKEVNGVRVQETSAIDGRAAPRLQARSTPRSASSTKGSGDYSAFNHLDALSATEEDVLNDNGILASAVSDDIALPSGQTGAGRRGALK